MSEPAPEQSRDDTDEGWGDWREAPVGDGDPDAADRHLLRERPPHHDRG